MTVAAYLGPAIDFDELQRGIPTMTHYFVDNREQPDGAHEVHAVGCKRMAPDKRYLGDFQSCEHAQIEARKEYWRTAGCVRCMDAGFSTAETGRLAQLVAEFSALRAANS